MIRRPILTRQTEADIRQIKAWGLENWGNQRARDFLAGLRSAIEGLCSRPQKGRPRSSLQPGLRSILYRGYLIFYVIRAEDIVVIGVIHERRNHAALDFSERMEKEKPSG